LRERVTSTPAETEAAGAELGRSLHAGDIVLLTGELGAGKTTFVRGVALGTGSAAPVASPTFQLVRVYPGRVQLAHVDLYRIESPTELADLGLEELADAGAVVVEWGDRLISSLVGRSGEAGKGRDNWGLIEIEHLGGDRRLLRTARELSH
jgi:tRNA threonylcarbamoyladenosine biosynthesis protein TsaE